MTRSCVKVSVKSSKKVHSWKGGSMTLSPKIRWREKVSMHDRGGLEPIAEGRVKALKR